MIKFLFTAICLAFLSGLSSRAQAQGDSCTATCSFSYQMNPNGQTVFTGQASGVTNPTFVWYVNGNASGNGAAYTGSVAAGDEVCLETTGYTYYYDSAQAWTDVDTCYAIYCDIIGQNPSNCNLQAWYTYSTNPNGVTTFVGDYSGSGQATFGWKVDETYVGNGQSTYSAVIPAGSDVCFFVSTWSYYYDSLTQQWNSDTCEAIYCETIGWGDSLGCDLQAWFTQSTNPNGVTTFTANHSDSNPNSILYFFWSVNGNEVAQGTTYSADLPAGTEVCLEAVAYGYYDSLQQFLNLDTCYATYCSVVGGPDSSDCNLQAWYSYTTNPNGVTTLTGDYYGTNDPQFFWLVNGNYVSGGQTYTANLPVGTEVCFEVRSYNFTYDSLQQWTDVDTCFATYCQVIGIPDSSDCGVQAWTTYSTDPNGVTTFTGNYSGTDQPSLFWLVNGNYVSGGQTYTANLPVGTEVCFEVRTYSFVYDSLQQWTDVDTCFTTYCQTLDQTAGLPGGEGQAIVTLYPNPAKTTLSVLLSTGLPAARVAILDVNGRSVLVTEVPDTIDVSALQQGVYYVKIMDTEGNMLTGIQRLIKE